MDLLPTKDELVPITDDKDVFFECQFNKDWNELDFKTKLQIVCDIVRQTMIYDEKKEEYEQLIGDSYTTSNITINYLKSLSLGTNYRCAFAFKKPYEIGDAYTTHTVTLVDDEEGNTFFLDSTPLIGYKYGKVGQIKEKYYEEYIIIEGELKRIYEELRKAKFDIINNNFNPKRINEVLNEFKKYSVLYVNLYEMNQMLRLKGFIFDDSIKYQYGIDRNKLIQELKKWKEELNDLIVSDTNLNRQLELSQLFNQI